MKRIGYFLKLIFAVLLTITTLGNEAAATHFHSAEVYWECITAGSDAGKFNFFVAIYKDCSNSNNIDPPQLNTDIPGAGSHLVELVPGYPLDVTPIQCGITCLDGIQDISIEKYLFVSTVPVAIIGPIPPTGYTFSYEPCCRINANNLVGSDLQTSFYSVTMYPFNGLGPDPCFDSSPQFAEPPNSIQCAGYELRYNSNAIDPDLDSLSYSFAEAIADGVPAIYVVVFSSTQPFPGPNLTQLDPVTGQLEYDSSPGVSGRYTVVMAIDAWRCGQRISRSIRDLTFAYTGCTEFNNIPTVAPPVWNSPAAGSGYAVTVQAGDLVNFSLTGIDNDIINGLPQTIELTAEGVQFSGNLTDPNSGCLNTPCATLSNSTPPTSGVGSVSTEFNWQTSCDQVGIFDQCGSTNNTYNFLFKFKDDYCPASGSNIVNVAVTVVAEPIIPSPMPHCVSLNAAGDAVTITWETVTDNNVPPSFVDYAIFHSTSPTGPFQEIGAVANINTGTYLHDGSNAVAAPTTSGPNYYQIRTRSGCNDVIGEAPLATVSSIYLSGNNTGTSAELSWTPMATPLLATANPLGYDLYREQPAGTWTLITTTTALSYIDPVLACGEQINYRVELTDGLPCVSRSNVWGSVFNSPLPDPQPIDSVTVDPTTGLATICWSVSTTLNVTGYNISVNPDQNAWDLIGSVVGYNNNCWTDPTGDPGSAPLWYRVTAINCAGEGISAGSSADGTQHHETIWLQVTVDGCDRSATLDWTRYWYWEEGVREYDIYSAVDGDPLIKIATVPGSQLSYKHEGLESDATYCHYVRAVKEWPTRITSTSNKVCSYVNVPKNADYGYNYNATVVTGNTGVEDYFFVDNTAEYLGFEIQRGTDPLSMDFLWFLNFDPTTEYYTYTDNSARPGTNSYYYSVIGVNTCEQHADTLNMSRTILLQAEAKPDRTNVLQWNAYEGWRGPITAYNIHRSVDGLYAFLTTVPGNQLTYTDPIEEIIIGEGNFCYYIEALEGIGPPVEPNTEPFQAISLSNEDCALQHPNVFVPNAFMPEGVNNIIRPVTVYVDVDSYLFQIYSRWGHRVFESTDPAIGWNGTINGNKAQQGVYAYFIRFVSSTGQTHTKRGTVTLIR